MRDFLGFLLILAVIFLVVGEINGWYIGIASQTPIVVYKKDAAVDTSRRTVTREDMPVRFTGQVRRGTVTVTVSYERSDSFQTGRQGQSRTVLYERAFRVGERIAIDERFTSGPGVYSVGVNYADATGVFRLTLPGGTDL
ncbi:MAG TPA: hypothetical protein VKZ43_03095 [Trueperaceae bacterium]|nr:hypothetical protein [Trueperaceae bacterium]